jgi:hypothetical protein
MTKVSRDQVTEAELHSFVADASELRWAPGEYPTLIETDLGNGLAMIVTAVTKDYAKYYQSNGCITLTVFND